MDMVLTENKLSAAVAICAVIALAGVALMAFPLMVSGGQIALAVGLAGMAGFGGLSIAFRGL